MQQIVVIAAFGGVVLGPQLVVRPKHSLIVEQHGIQLSGCATATATSKQVYITYDSLLRCQHQQQFCLYLAHAVCMALHHPVCGTSNMYQQHVEGFVILQMVLPWLGHESVRTCVQQVCHLFLVIHADIQATLLLGCKYRLHRPSTLHLLLFRNQSKQKHGNKVCF